jgi:tRNA threonylcarbamoyladenosine biosynthesis protein TsaE
VVVTARPFIALRTDGPDGTRALAAAVAGLCRPGDVVLLVGDLGTGKTTFAQGFGAALGVRDAIVSPTFTLVRQYPLPVAARQAGGAPPIRQLVHADLYRLSYRHEVVDLGLGQLVEDGGVAVVEWGEAAEPALGDDWMRVALEAGDDGEARRTIHVTARGGTWPARWPSVEAALRPWRCEA